MSNNLTESGKRYICFTIEQQEAFDRLGEKAQRFVMFVANGGFSKRAAYVAAGYKDTPNAKKGAYMLEKRIPMFQEFVAALRGQNNKMQAYDPDSAVSKQIDEIAKGGFEEPPIVPAEVIGTGNGLNLVEMSAENARRAQFYRDIVTGKAKTRKVTKTYDKDRQLTGYKIEETTDVAAQMRARLELDKVLGVSEMLQVGQVKAGSITIKIVDCANHEALEDPRNNMIVGELSEETSDE